MDAECLPELQEKDVPGVSEVQSRIQLDDKFWIRFREQLKDVEAEINQLSLADKDVRAHIDALKKTCQTIQQDITGATLYLTKYSEKRAMAQLSELRAMLSQSEEELAPKKKFSFSSRKKAGIAETTTPHSQHSEPKSKESSSVAVHVDAKQSRVGFSKKSNQTLQLNGDTVSHNDVELSHLDSCAVHIQGSPSSVHISQLVKTKVLLGPCQFSVFINDCKDCQFSIACQQLRIHKSTHCTFSIHVTSTAIVEDCSDIAFAPYNLTYGQIEDDFKQSSLDTSTNHWDKVEDFNWLSREPSPHWHILPVGDRTKEEC